MLRRSLIFLSESTMAKALVTRTPLRRMSARFVPGEEVEDFLALAREGIGADRFEFQMLHGVRRDLQQQLREEGYAVRVYVPFGVSWYPYLMRRLAERPASVLFLAGSVVKESPWASCGPREMGTTYESPKRLRRSGHDSAIGEGGLETYVS